MSCDKKKRGDKTCEVCGEGYYMENLAKVSEGTFVLSPYFPLYITKTINDENSKDTFYCNHGEVIK
jgi:hypothetical protein